MPPYATNYTGSEYWGGLRNTTTATVYGDYWTSNTHSGFPQHIYTSPCDCTWEWIEIGGVEHRVRAGVTCPYCAYAEYKQDLADVIDSLKGNA